MNIFDSLLNSLKKKSETQENGVGKLLTSAAPSLIKNKLSSTINKEAERVEKFSNVTAPDTFFKLFNALTSAPLRGAYEEGKKGGLPQAGALKGIYKGLTNKDYYSGQLVEEKATKMGAAPLLAAGLNLGTELLIPGVGGEKKSIEKISSLADTGNITSKLKKFLGKGSLAEEAATNLKNTNKKLLKELRKFDKGPVEEGLTRTYQVVEEGKKTPWVFDAEDKLRKFIGNTDTSTSNIIIKDIPNNLLTKVEEGVYKVKSGATSDISKIQDVPPNPIQKLLSAIEKAEPARAGREAAFTAERSRRIGEAAEVGKKVSGEQGYLAQLGKLTGELPKPKFEPIRTDLDQTDIDSLFNTIRENAKIGDFEKITAQTGLKTLLEGGLPVESQLKLLKEVYGPEIVKTLLDKRTFFPKMVDAAGEVLNVPRALMASFDVSAPFRQGIMMVTRPKQFFPAMKSMFKQFASGDAYKAAQEEIISRPSYELMKQAKLDITDIGGSLSSKEEAFMSNLAEKIPGLGVGVKASSRAYTGFLNKLRADTFDDIVKSAKETGTELDEKTLTSLGEFINTFTGRGALPKALQGAAPVLNGVFFSPRLMSSRLQILNPQFYAKLPPVVRKQAIYSLFSTLGLGATMLGLAKAGGAEVGTDVRSADFGKIKLGNTRIDVWGGLQQYARLAGQLYTGEMISTNTGKLSKVGEGNQPVSRMDIISRFLQSKEAPVVSFITNLFKGEDSLGNPIDVPKELLDRITPMVVGDMYDLYKEHGPEALPLAIPSMLGMGISTYGKTEPKAELNEVGQPILKMSPVSDLGQDILKFLRQEKEVSTEGAKPQGGANAWFKYLKSLSPEEANKKLAYVKENNPQLASLIQKEMKYEKIGTTPEDESLLKLGVTDGKRASAIAKNINKLKTPEEKNTYYKRLRESGIISDSVVEQLKLLKDRGEL